MKMQIYSDKELPREARTTFKLPGDPYAEKKEVLDYLRSLNIVYYRDENGGSDGVVVDEEVLDRKPGWPGYRSLGVINSKYEIMNWPTPESLEERRALAKKQKDDGDTKAWILWNQELVIVRIVHNMVSLA